MKDTYKAVEVSAPGVLRVVERPVSEPRTGQVRIRLWGRSVYDSLAGTTIETEDALAFSVLENIRPMIGQLLLNRLLMLTLG
jgi:D-arabinose 1-dehydrogenase-like Zn-dependent alcohol dehydrogenase